ncbi:MAG: M42 family metallopeptidase [Oscillospiraceae bacterium]|jgi:endoglucanase|nr:M42 family metallopeptidase [Oscillospiraceae bacterium]
MMKDTLLAVLKPFGPSGCEQPIAAAIAEMVRPYVDEIRSDAMGNLICTKKGAGKRIMLSSHMDQIGYIVMEADKEGFLRVNNVGGIRVVAAPDRHIVFENGVQGVIGMDDLKEGEKPAIGKLYIDVGAETREEALAKVPLGMMGVLAFQVSDMGDRIAAPYLDDRAACAVQVEVLKALEKTDNEVVAVFSVQEEVGCRGAQVAAYAIEPDIGLAIDVTGAGDTPECAPLPMKVGKGPCIKIKDSRSISSPVVRDGLVEAAKVAGVPYQFEILPFGGTDAGAIMTSRGGVPSATVSITCRYVHSPAEMVSIRDMEQAVAMIKAYIEKILK